MSLLKNRKIGKAKANKEVTPFENIQIHWQKRIAAWMESKSNGLSLTGKKIVLICMLLTGGAYCFYLVISVFDHNKKPASYSVSRISIPEYTGQNGDNKISKHSAISKKEFERIHRFHLYLDSLAQSPSSRKLYDSIIRGRPGLLNSIIIIENIYQSQTKK